MEHKFANIQTVFNFLRGHEETLLNGEQTKTNMGRGIMLIRIFALKAINNERKPLTHHEIIDLIAEQIQSVIIPVYKGSKLWINPNLLKFFIYLFI